jgi:hypothetical protein
MPLALNRPQPATRQTSNLYHQLPDGASAEEPSQIVEKRRVVLDALRQRTIAGTDRGDGLRRSKSFSGLTAAEDLRRRRTEARVAATKLALAAARVQLGEAKRISRIAALCLFELLLALGYAFYRMVGCNPAILNWECHQKTFELHWEDVSQMLAIGGVLFATGPTVDVFGSSVPFGPSPDRGRQSCLAHYLPAWSGMIFTPLIVYLSAMMTFAALGESPLLMLSLASTATWKPPALYVIVAGIALGASIAGYSLWISRSRYELAVSLVTLVLIALLYSSAAIVTFVLGDDTAHPVFHPHHYQIAYHFSLLLRNEADPPTILIRWLLIGVFVQGIAAYSPASMLNSS